MPRHSGTRNGESQSHVEACADAAVVLADKYEPAEALSRWLHRLVEFVGAKRGLATALHSGDPAYAALPDTPWTVSGALSGNCWRLLSP